MTPKEKAVYLYNKFKLNKTFANICIIEIKNTNLNVDHLRYWESVRIELNAL